ncbi:Mitotic spindle checkpoint component mad2 [Tieghemiomyces parasiticus]|uniref:Mitotic spindle checkpoint component mad2 n=1 Tax=Tieghemiomyces parasiticus TaxID=78921 RepID=A0A9W8DLW9_9FUNG|nr:Mitotic spindle checkpoint component mad2 [Tieghemiomyces parasiticus]
MSAAQTTKGRITLRGSTQMVAEFFGSILFQRGLYPPEDFKMIKKYGLNMLVSSDDALKAYLKQITLQLENWLMAGKLSKLVMAINSKETRETIERWQFDIHIMNDPAPGETPAAPKTEKAIHTEIAAIIRQITASVTFLPMLEEKYAEVPTTWIDSDPHYIKKNAEQVKLRSFSTDVHKVDALVAYRLDGEL